MVPSGNAPYVIVGLSVGRWWRDFIEINSRDFKK